MAKAKVKKSEGSIMEQLAAYSPPWDEPAEKKDAADPNAGLVERFARLEAEHNALKQQQAYQNFTTPAPAAAAPVVQPRAPEFNYEGLPDPVTHPKEYTSELVKRLNAINDAKMQGVHEAALRQEQAQFANQAMEGFKKSKPEWAQHDMLTQAAAARVSQEMQAKGVDVVRLLRQQPDLFYNEVAGRLDKEYPTLKAKAEGEEEAGEEASRTAGVFGGTPGKAGGGEPMPSADENEQWLREVTSLQYKAGLK